MIWRSLCVDNILLKAPIAFAHGQFLGRIEFTAESGKVEPAPRIFAGADRRDWKLSETPN
jgi:hypothetical protein